MLSRCYKSEPVNPSDFKVYSIEELNNLKFWLVLYLVLQQRSTSMENSNLIWALVLT